MLDDVTQSTWVIVFSTLMGPVLAVQAQKLIERATEKSRRRFAVFNALMVTKGTRLDLEHVLCALNSIDIEFRDYPKVIEAWRLYVAHLNALYDRTNEAQSIQWQAKGSDLLIELLTKIAKAVRVKIDRERLSGIYIPEGHFKREVAQLEVLNNAAAVLSGKQSLKMSVVDFPFSKKQQKRNLSYRKNWENVVADGVVHVEIKGPSATQ